MNPAGRRPSSSTSRRSLFLLFFGLLLVYMSLSPFSAANMGYTSENMAACRQIRETSLSAATWPRNGAVSLAFECPFMALGRAVSSDPAAEDRALSFLPAAATSLMLTLLFAWVRALSRPVFAFWLTLAAAFGTLLFPYAYIGLETTQSLFLFLAAYLAIGPRTSALSWPRALAIGVSAGVAMSAKSGGFMLAPVVAYLFFALLREPGPARRRAGQVLLALAVALAIFAVNNHIRGLYWERMGGTVAFARSWLVRSIAWPPLNLLALIASPNKGLVVFAPLALVGLAAIPRAFRRQPRVATLGLLTFLSLAGGLSLIRMWADDTWGPRYLHSAVAPLALVLAACATSRAWRRAIAGAAAAGFAVSILGVLFYYGSMGGAANAVTTPTIEDYQGDPMWNHLTFNLLLTSAWLHPDSPDPVLVPRPRQWNLEDDSVRPVWRPFDVRPMAQPQPFILKRAISRAAPGDAAVYAFGLASLVAGVSLLVYVRRRVGREVAGA